MTPDGLSFDTDKLPLDQRFSAWASGMTHYAVRTPDPLAFHASIRAWLLAPVIVVDATLSEIGFRRDLDRIRADGGDDIVLQLLDGTTFSGALEDREVVAGSGEIVVHDRARPLDAGMTAGRNVTVSMPRAFLEEQLPAASVHGLVLRDGLALPLAAFLGALPQVLAADRGESGEIARLLRDLVAAAIRRSAPPTVEQQLEGTLRMRARHYVRQNLGAELDVNSLCLALGVSRSRLYRAFEAEGGVGRFVTRERLKRVHRLLTDPAERSPIAQLAAAHGFHDSAHFSRLFRRTFGYGPQALRRRLSADAAGSADVVDGEAAPAVYNSWEASRG